MLWLILVVIGYLTAIFEIGFSIYLLGMVNHHQDLEQQSPQYQPVEVQERL